MGGCGSRRSDAGDEGDIAALRQNGEQGEQGNGGGGDASGHWDLVVVAVAIAEVAGRAALYHTPPAAPPRCPAAAG